MSVMIDPGALPMVAPPAAVRRNVCVFLGSRSGASPAFFANARQFGELIAERGLGLVYGGAAVGCMGAVADGALSKGGHVLGIIPRFMDQEAETVHRGLPELVLVDSMHERKLLMANNSDAFVTLPGGIGTLEEVFEILTWRQLKLHNKPIYFLNVNGFFDPLRTMLLAAVTSGFFDQESVDEIVFESDPAALADRVKADVVAAASLTRRLSMSSRT